MVFVPRILVWAGTPDFNLNEFVVHATKYTEAYATEYTRAYALAHCRAN